MIPSHPVPPHPANILFPEVCSLSVELPAPLIKPHLVTDVISGLKLPDKLTSPSDRSLTAGLDVMDRRLGRTPWPGPQLTCSCLNTAGDPGRCRGGSGGGEGVSGQDGAARGLELLLDALVVAFLQSLAWRSDCG